MDERWVTVSEAVAILGASDRTIRRWAKKGRLPADRSGAALLVDIAKHVPIGAVAVPSDALSTCQAEIGALQAEVERLVAELAKADAEVKRLGDVLAEVRSERDYLRQAHAALMQNVALLTERAGERPPRRFRWPWQRREG